MLRKIPAKNAVLFAIVIILLTLGFYRNQWHAAGKKWFYEWKTNSDVMLVARLVWSRQTSVFSDGALLGVGDGQWPMLADTKLHQYDSYMNNKNFSIYWTYDSMTGGQGVIFSVLNKLTNLPPNLSLKIFRGMTSLLSALALTLIVLWFSAEFNLFSALMVFGYCVLSEWLTLFAGSLFFQLWAFYIPPIGIAIYLRRTKDQENISAFHFTGLAALTVVVKTLFNGFEFITPTLGMMFIPVIYYALIRNWGAKTIINLFIKVSVGILIGTLLSLIILALQISVVKGSWYEAFQYIAYTYEKRTTGTPIGITENATISVLSILREYIIGGRALYIGSWFDPNFTWLQNPWEISYFQLFVTFILFSLIFIIYSKKDRASHMYRKTLVLLYTTWFSILSPLSWLILFKAHAENHFHLDYIVWQMPFTLFGFALCGMVISYLISLNKKLKEVPPTQTAAQKL